MKGCGEGWKRLKQRRVKRGGGRERGRLADRGGDRVRVRGLGFGSKDSGGMRMLCWFARLVCGVIFYFGRFRLICGVIFILEGFA